MAVLFSPYYFPVDAESLNYAPVIMAIVTVFALISWWVVPESAWLPKDRITHFIESQGVEDSLEQER